MRLYWRADQFRYHVTQNVSDVLNAPFRSSHAGDTSFQRRGLFGRVTVAGLRESHVHDVIITKEAPNYRLE